MNGKEINNEKQYKFDEKNFQKFNMPYGDPFVMNENTRKELEKLNGDTVKLLDTLKTTNDEMFTSSLENFKRWSDVILGHKKEGNQNEFD